MQLKSVHLLVAGDKQVGKSAKIVRLTTGRFIHDYSHTTDDWLYKRQLVANALDRDHDHDGKPPVTLEILELGWSQLDCSVCELKPEVANRFHWAQAFVVMYSITSFESFIRAKSCMSVALRFQERGQRSCHSERRQKTEAAAAAAPILLLANKSDLSAQARQVPLEEGQKLAQENECLFAEVSILEARENLLDGLMLELVKRLEPGAFGGHSASDWACVDCGVETPLVRWQHKPAAAAAAPADKLVTHPISHSSESIPRVKCAPVSSQLIRFQSSAVVAATVAFCRPLLSKNPTAAAPLETAQTRAASQQEAAAAQMAHVQTIGPPPLAASTTSVSRVQPASKQRATSLKTSFKKASLAIVGGRSLAFKNKQAAAASAKQSEPMQQSTSSLHSSGSSTLSLSSSISGVATAASSGQKPSGKSANWIRSRFSLRQEAPVAISQNQASGSRRPMFKYRERVKTVAFEPSYGANSQVNPLNERGRLAEPMRASEFIRKATSTDADVAATATAASSTFDEAPLEKLNEFAARKISVDGNSLSSYTLNRRTSSSGRSSPSLSTSEATFHGSLLGIDQQQQQQQRQQLNQFDQRPPSGARIQNQTSNRASRQLLQQQQRPASGDCNCNDNYHLNGLAESRCSSATFFIGTSNHINSNNNNQNLVMASGHRTILNKLNQRKDSRSTLSRASTSGGSYGDDEDEDDDNENDAGEEADDEVGPLGDGGGLAEWPGANSWPERRASLENTTRTNASRPIGCQLVTSVVGLAHQPIIERLQQQPALSIGGMISEAQQVVRTGKMSFCRALIKSIASPNAKRPSVESATSTVTAKTPGSRLELA